MSQKYSGGFITKSPVAPTTSAASGIWTLDQQMQAQKAGTWPSPPIFIEDVFSTYLYTGTGAAMTINNGIDLAGNGGMVWVKSRSNADNHGLFDTNRGQAVLYSNLTNAQDSGAGYFTSFNSNGFTLPSTTYWVNSGYTYASWTFRKQPKFFDIVTYTGNGVNNTLISHNLGSTPGCVIIKRTDTAENWAVAHRGNGTGSAWTRMSLNSTSAGSQGVSQNYVTSTTVRVDDVTGAASSPNGCNVNGATYVMYLFAHDAGGFPVSGGGSTNGISCGSFTTDASGNATVTLGYEPQFIIRKRSDDTSNWDMADIMRRMDNTDFYRLRANLSNAEDTVNGGPLLIPTATGFTAQTLGNTATHIYIAIRRGPMKTPTTGTSVFSPISSTAAYNTALTTDFPVDMQIEGYPPGDSLNMSINDRLRGVSTNATQNTLILTTSSTAAEASPNATMTNFWGSTGFRMPQYYGSSSYISWNFRRAPSFFDEVCYTGDGNTNRAVTHNLTVTPELAIFKNRTTAGYNWVVKTTATFGTNSYLILEGANSLTTNASYGATATASQITLSTGGSNTGDWNASGNTYVAYLFATCAGVSKVGSYTGTGAAQTINCGFTAGSRFVLIKRTDSTGDWYVWDSARGIIPANDPYLLINSTAAEVTGTDYVDTTNVGFDITSTAPAAINANGGTYIFLAIA